MVEAQAVADALMAATINTVSLKLPEFSPDRIEYWFIAVEAEFNLRVPAITQDQIRYSYVVSALKGQVMDRVINIIRNPPAAGTCYQAIKDRLLSAFSRSPLERSKMLLDWPGMGDGTPSASLARCFHAYLLVRTLITSCSRLFSYSSSQLMSKTTWPIQLL